MKLTPWFPANTRPVRSGVYGVKLPQFPTAKYAYFNAERGQWNLSHVEVQSAARMFSTSSLQDRQWRGLAEKPE